MNKGTHKKKEIMKEVRVNENEEIKRKYIYCNIQGNSLGGILAFKEGYEFLKGFVFEVETYMPASLYSHICFNIVLPPSHK